MDYPLAEQGLQSRPLQSQSLNPATHQQPQRSYQSQQQDLWGWRTSFPKLLALYLMDQASSPLGSNHELLLRQLVCEQPPGLEGQRKDLQVSLLKIANHCKKKLKIKKKMINQPLQKFNHQK